MDVASPVKTDGRQLRRQRNRESVVDALLELYRGGNLRPSTEEIAARSGLSPRSLFRYFDDADDLTRTAILRIERQAADLFPIDVEPSAELDTRARALVDQRFTLFDTVGSAAAVSRLRSPFQPILADRLKRNRSLLRSQIESLFAPELTLMERREAGVAVAAADVLTSFESHQLLLRDQQLSAELAKETMSSALVALLGTGR
jgi:AcrR family transcriptional regulator